MKHEDVTRRIIAAAMKVHSALGNGFQEVIYQRAMELEMPFEQLNFKREMEMPIHYRDEVIGRRRVDFFVEDLVMVELRSISSPNIIIKEEVHN
jgi:GxxExxY protein